MLHFEDIVLGQGAGSGCVRCKGESTETLRDQAEIVCEIRDVARTWGAKPGPNLTLTGAEPFHHPALGQIVADAVNAGAQRICLDSDCAALGSAETARTVLDSGVRHMQFTLLGSTPALHDALLGRPGAFEATMNGVSTFVEIARAGEVPVHVSARLPVCHHNLRDLPMIVTAAARAGAAKARLVIEDPGLDLRSAAPWVEAACDSGIVNSLWVEVQGVPHGLAGGWELHLASIYRQVPGAKSSRCETCSLNDVCGGATLGACAEVTAAFRPPADATRMAECVRRGFDPPGCDHV
jgi:hypothetical protein